VKGNALFLFLIIISFFSEIEEGSLYLVLLPIQLLKKSGSEIFA